MTIRALSRWFRELWMPALVVGLASAAAVGVSSHFESERRAQILRSTQSIAAESRAAIHDLLEHQRMAARDRAFRWSRFGRSPLPEWQLDAQHLMKNVPGFSYVAWVSLGGAPARIAPARIAPARIAPSSEPPHEIGPDEAEARAHAAAPTVVGPMRRSDGSFGYRLYEPVPRGADSAGVLVAEARVDAVLADLLEQSAPGYAISIFWGDQQIVARGQPARERDLAWWRAEGEVLLPPGPGWRVVHEPTEALAATLLTPFPRHLLGVGLLLAAAAGVIVHQLRLSGRNSRFLESAMLEARQGEVSLRRLSEELEQRVRSRTRQLEDTMSELEAFNFSVSHDLRSPIGAVLNFVVILEEEHQLQLDPAGREILARIRGSAERATALLEGLLKLSRAGRAELEIEALDMTTLAREAFAQARATAGDGEFEFELATLPPTRGDRALLGSVFVNLLGNAIKYTRGCEKRRIEVSGYESETENVYAVSDNGVGFDGRFANKLFGAFERLHSRERFEGAGIGLAIVARIVQRHGGRAWAESRPEHGASFFFSLPRSDRSRE